MGAKDLQLDCAVLGGDWELPEGFMMGNNGFVLVLSWESPSEALELQGCRGARWGCSCISVLAAFQFIFPKGKQENFGFLFLAVVFLRG